MPTISQLPSATTVSADDEVLISQGGVARAASVGILLASTQPAIVVESSFLLGRSSIGPGGPEQINVGTGVSLSNGTLKADGLDHAGFQEIASLSIGLDVVISNQGSPMLMQASLLRGLFSAGQNITIDSNGVISTAAEITVAGTVAPPSIIDGYQVITEMTADDLVAVGHAGSDYAIAYSNFLDGVTIDQAQAAGPVSDFDTIWAAQNSNVMVSQTFSSIWGWVANKLSTYKVPVVEITTNITLDTTVHNGRILVCSQPITLTSQTTSMGAGFQCTVINASIGNLTLGSGFISSNGSLVLAPWQSAVLSCVTYSAGTIAFAAMPMTASMIAVPGQVIGLSASNITTTTIITSWQSPSSGGLAASYVVQFRPTGTTSWSSSAPVVGATTYELTSLEPSTSYDITVGAQNAIGLGVVSTVVTAVTASTVQQTVPLQVAGFAAIPTSSGAIQLNWLAQTGTSAATSFTVQYRVTGSPTWTSTVPGITGTGTTISGLEQATSYDFSVIGVNGTGGGPVSSTVMAVTPVTPQLTVPPQVTGLTATPTSSSAVQLSWSSQTGSSAATSFTIQYRVTGSSSWTYSVAGITGTADAVSSLAAATSYDFCVTGDSSAAERVNDFETADVSI